MGVLIKTECLAAVQVGPHSPFCIHCMPPFTYQLGNSEFCSGTENCSVLKDVIDTIFCFSGKSLD